MNPRKLSTALAALWLKTSIATAATGENVVLIMVDDLRHPDPWMIAPHLRQFESESISFVNAHCQVATCNPSRASIFSGLRAASSGVYHNTVNVNQVLVDENGEPWEYLPTLLRNNGYRAISVGKVFHGHFTWWHPPNAWDELYHLNLRDAAPVLEEEHIGGIIGQTIRKTDGGGDALFEDGRICGKALEVLEQRAADDIPFFLAIGFNRPHTPFTAPVSFFDLYPEGSIPLPTPEPDFITQGYWRHLFLEDQRVPPTEEQVLKTRHAYAACVSYVDSQIGRVLQKMKDLGMYESTVTILLSDHGYQLGEKNYFAWHKPHQLERTTCTPFMIKVPGAKPARVNAAVELLDLYPTVAELCGSSVSEPIEGQSLVPLIENPESASSRVACTEHSGVSGSVRWSGYSLRGAEYRFTKMFKQWNYDILVDSSRDPLETDNLLLDENLEPEGEVWVPMIEAMKEGIPDRVVSATQRIELLPDDPNMNDRDRDGLNDVWELRMGLDPTSPNAAHSDADQYSDFEEFLFNTDPRDSQSRFELRVVRIGSGIHVSFDGRGRDYVLEAYGADQAWSEVGVFPGAVGLVETVLPMEDAAFFRVAVTLPSPAN